MTGQVLTLNAGSSSLKFALFDAEMLASDGFLEGVPQFWGQAQNLGQVTAQVDLRSSSGLSQSMPLAGQGERAPGHQEALQAILMGLRSHNPGLRVSAVGHRVVHGGEHLDAPRLVNGALLAELDALAPLAPLHQHHNLAGIRAAQKAFPDIAQVACFDTAFHRTQPSLNQRYALPTEWFERGVRRYGFHGLSYESVASRLRLTVAELGQADARTVVAHLGNGASLCAMRGLRSVATTMGFSPLEGMPMGTRCGRVDAAAVLHLIESGLGVDAVTDLLYRRSGLFGLSGLSGDVRTLSESDSPNAAMALAYFVEHARREIAGMAAAIGGIDALVFTGGIGENAAGLRADILAGLTWMGCQIDPAANSARPAAGGTIRRISTTGSVLAVYVVPTNEEAMIARHTLEVMHRS